MPTNLGEVMPREARISQILMEHQHPNVATYHGCIVEGGRITSLCFTRYHQTLVERIYHDSRPVDTQGHLQEIERQIEHLHTVGIVHNGIDPSNIMLITEYIAVIIDFIFCSKGGEEGYMGSTYPWTDASYNDNRAGFENDMCGLRIIREWLRDPAPFFRNGHEDGQRHEQQGNHGQLEKDCYICA